MSDTGFLRQETIDRLNEILARYAADEREKELQEAWDDGYEQGQLDIYYECDCEDQELCYDPEHLSEEAEASKLAQPSIEEIADAICERPI